MKPSQLIPASIRRYLKQSHDPLTSLVLILPLFLAYQIGVLTTGGVRNGVDFMTDFLFLVSGGSLLGYLGVNAAILLGLVFAIFWLRRTNQFRPQLFPWIMLESAIYAVFFGSAVLYLARFFGFGALLAIGGLSNRLVMSIGAGLYEELVFRWMLMSGLFLLGTRYLRQPAWLVGIAALLVSSVVFSAVHHIGNMAEAFTLSAFIFRFFAGVLLATIYSVRGLAVAVYTHAFYDVIVLVFLGQD